MGVSVIEADLGHHWYIVSKEVSMTGTKTHVMQVRFQVDR
jgi:hypothetical protein